MSKTYKRYSNKKNKTKSKKGKYRKLPKCNNSKGVLGEQEDIFTLGQCRQTGGYTSISPHNPTQAPINNIASSIPGPFVGNSWGSSIKDWPGVDGISGDRNYNAYNNYNPDVQLMIRNENEIRGGKRKKKLTKRLSKRKIKKGGGIFSNLHNIGSDISFRIGSLYNTLNGYPTPVNPNVFRDQIPTLNIKQPVNY